MLERVSEAQRYAAAQMREADMNKRNRRKSKGGGGRGGKENDIWKGQLAEELDALTDYFAEIIGGVDSDSDSDFDKKYADNEDDEDDGAPLRPQLADGSPYPLTPEPGMDMIEPVSCDDVVKNGKPVRAYQFLGWFFT